MGFEYLKVFTGRRFPFEYISPAVCEGEFSSSGTPFISLLPILRAHGPTGSVMSADGNRFHFSWNTVLGALCYSVYKAVDEMDPFGPYTLVAECITDTFFDTEDPGVYKVDAINPDGVTEFGDPIHTPPPGAGAGDDQPADPDFYWPLDELDGDRVDAIAGIHLVPSDINGPRTDAVRTMDGLNNPIAALFNDATNPFLDTLFGGIQAGLAYPGGGVTVAGRFLPTALPGDGTNEPFRLFAYQSTDGAFNVTFFKLTVSVTQFVLSIKEPFGSADIQLTVPNTLDTSTWHFYRAWFDPADGLIRLQIDHGAISASTTPYVFPTTRPYGTFSIQGGLHTPILIGVDEMAMWFSVLTNNNDSWLWNGGGGRTWPF